MQPQLSRDPVAWRAAARKREIAQYAGILSSFAVPVGALLLVPTGLLFSVPGPLRLLLPGPSIVVATVACALLVVGLFGFSTIASQCALNDAAGKARAASLPFIAMGSTLAAVSAMLLFGNEALLVTLSGAAGRVHRVLSPVSTSLFVVGLAVLGALLALRFFPSLDAAAARTSRLQRVKALIEACKPHVGTIVSMTAAASALALAPAAAQDDARVRLDEVTIERIHDERGAAIARASRAGETFALTPERVRLIHQLASNLQTQVLARSFPQVGPVARAVRASGESVYGSTSLAGQYRERLAKDLEEVPDGALRRLVGSTASAAHVPDEAIASRILESVAGRDVVGAGSTVPRRLTQAALDANYDAALVDAFARSDGKHAALLERAGSLRTSFALEHVFATAARMPSLQVTAGEGRFAYGEARPGAAARAVALDVERASAARRFGGFARFARALRPFGKFVRALPK